jgi:hypothetical protein
MQQLNLFWKDVYLMKCAFYILAMSNLKAANATALIGLQFAF